MGDLTSQVNTPHTEHAVEVSVVSGEETSDLRPAALPAGAMSVSEGERQQERQQAVKRSHETPGQAQDRQEQDTAAKKLKQDLTVVPILLQGLASLARERPRDPIEYLAGYLM